MPFVITEKLDEKLIGRMISPNGRLMESIIIT
jgi:hypothetical protein